MYSKLCITVHIFAHAKGGACFHLSVAVNTLMYRRKMPPPEARKKRYMGCTPGSVRHLQCSEI